MRDEERPLFCCGFEPREDLDASVRAMIAEVAPDGADDCCVGSEDFRRVEFVARPARVVRGLVGSGMETMKGWSVGVRRNFERGGVL